MRCYWTGFSPKAGSVCAKNTAIQETQGEILRKSLMQMTKPNPLNYDEERELNWIEGGTQIKPQHFCSLVLKLNCLLVSFDTIWQSFLRTVKLRMFNLKFESCETIKSWSCPRALERTLSPAYFTISQPPLMPSQALLLFIACVSQKLRSLIN